jgi:DNA-binding CsgD family transcriptional regulator
MRVLFGRSGAFERIDRLLASARSGQSGVLLILGEPGIGKTALLEVARERGEGMRTLATRGVPSEADIPFAGLLELLRPLLSGLDGLPERQAQALSGALGIGSPAPGDRFLIGAATLTLLAAAAESEPVLILIDDAHWLDGESLDALVFAVRRLDADAVAGLIAARPEEIRLESVDGLDTLELGALDATDTARLVELHLGRRLNKPDTARIFRLTGGNPLAVIEIGTSDEALAFDAPATLSRGVEDAYSRRLRDLPPGVRAMLLMAAIDDTLDAVTVERAGASIGGTATLADAETSGLIALIEGRVAFRHPLVRSAIYQSATADQRRAAHAAVAETLEGGAQSGRRAWHEAAAALAPDEGVAAALERAADEARDRGGYRAAAVALERAAHLTPHSGERARRLHLAAASAFHAGRAEQANRLVDAAVAACTDPLLRADIQLLHGALLNASGAMTEAYRLMLVEGRRVASHDAARGALLLDRACLNRIHIGAMHDALEIGREARQLAEQVGGDLEQHVGSTLAKALIFNGQIDEAELLLRGSIAATRAGGLRDPHALNRMAVNLNYLCEFPACRDAAAEAVELARSQGALGILPALADTLATTQIGLGEWEAASATATESLRLAYDTDQSHYGALLLWVLADIAAFRGRSEECRAHFAEAAALDGGHVSWAGHDAAETAFGHLALARGEIDEAIGHLEREVDPDAEQAAFGFYYAAFDLAEAYVRANRSNEATSLIERIAPHTHQAWARAALDRCRGLVAADDAFDAPSRAAVEGFARLQMPFEEARARLCRGERLRRARRSIEARDEFRAALAAFERLHAEPWAVRARRELEAAGETPRRRAPSTVANLTPQELQVASIVASGATNREAAARLFLSPKTIEAHLHRTYRKLGLTGRAQLRNSLAETADDQAGGVPGRDPPSL